jgi:hypothetical protein
MADRAKAKARALLDTLLPFAERGISSSVSSRRVC